MCPLCHELISQPLLPLRGGGYAHRRCCIALAAKRRRAALLDIATLAIAVGLAAIAGGNTLTVIVTVVCVLMHWSAHTAWWRSLWS